MVAQSTFSNLCLGLNMGYNLYNVLPRKPCIPWPCRSSVTYLPREFLTIKSCPDSQSGEHTLSNIMALTELCQLLCKRESSLPSVRVIHEHSYFSRGDRLDSETQRTISFGSRRRIQSRHYLCRHLKMLVRGRLN